MGYVVPAKKKQAQNWEPPREIAVSPVAGYNHFMQSYTTDHTGPDGTLHLIFQFHFASDMPSGHAADCRGRAAVHAYSEDGGDTWFNEGTRFEDPLTMETMRAICHDPHGGDGQHSVRVGNHVVDANNQPWFFCSYPGYQSGVLWHRSDAGMGACGSIPSPQWLEHGRWTRDIAIPRSQRADCTLHLQTHPHKKRCEWFSPELELFYAILDEKGALISLDQLTETDNAAANWLPALEQWDWTRPHQKFDNGHWMMYTRGLNAGGIGGDNQSALKTEIYLTR